MSKFLFLFSCEIFLLGCAGFFLFRANPLFSLMAVELCLFGGNLVMIFSSYSYQEAAGQVFALFVLGSAAAESVVGLLLIVLCQKSHQTIEYKFLNLLKN